MIARNPLEAVELLDEAFNRGEIEAVLDFYEAEAVMVAEPGRLATGKTEIRVCCCNARRNIHSCHTP